MSANQDLIDAAAWLDKLAPFAGKMVREGDLEALAARLRARATPQTVAQRLGRDPHDNDELDEW